jgi:hypothetical protein
MLRMELNQLRELKRELKWERNQLIACNASARS